MGLSFEFFETAGSAVADGVFIPRADLIGISAGEFADSESVAIKENKLLYAIANKLTDGVLGSALGITATIGAITGQSALLSSKAYSFAVQYYADQENEIIDVLPAPSIGSQVGVGEVSVIDIFPNAVKVAAAGAVSGEGVVIPSALIADYGAPVHGSLTLANDCRSYIAALIRYMVSKIDLRTASVASAVTAKSIAATAGVTLPAIATDATNPTTGINSSMIDKLDFYSRTMTMTIQRIENESTQMFDVNVVTA